MSLDRLLSEFFDFFFDFFRAFCVVSGFVSIQVVEEAEEFSGVDFFFVGDVD